MNLGGDVETLVCSNNLNRLVALVERDSSRMRVKLLYISMVASPRVVLRGDILMERELLRDIQGLVWDITVCIDRGWD